MTRNIFVTLLTLLFFGTLASPAHAFCGFFVSKAGAELFNEASKVVLSRGDDRTVITMVNDYQGDLDEFAIVIPVPTAVTRKQVNVTETRIIEHLDAYTAPRLVEYHDQDPCQQIMYRNMMAMDSAAPQAEMSGVARKKSAKALGVTIEDEYTVGEYDIVILSAKQSDGLQTYLNQEGYKMPDGASKVLNSYIKQDMKFFLAKVNLDKQAKSGFTYLRPLQVAYEHEKFMLPIRLGTLNANGPQDLILYTLTQKGRVETSNYRTTKIPSDTNIPLFVKEDFGNFYKAMFDEAVKKENMKTVFLEYAWDMGWCDPCAADPVPNEDLRTLGAWWVGNSGDRPSLLKAQRRIMPPQSANTYVTRLHVRYDAKTFPEDLMLQETSDRSNFQGRYVMNNPWTGDMGCDAGRDYVAALPARFEKEAQNLSNLTGWSIGDIRKKMETGGQSFEPQDPPSTTPWWEDIWND
jgi:hypothetical protein